MNETMSSQLVIILIISYNYCKLPYDTFLQISDSENEDDCIRQRTPSCESSAAAQPQNSRSVATQTYFTGIVMCLNDNIYPGEHCNSGKSKWTQTIITGNVETLKTYCEFIHS